MSQGPAYLEESRQRFLSEFLELLRIESVSTDPARRQDVQTAAQWTAQRLRRAGIEHVEVFETAGHPVVCGDWLHAPGKPTVLFYGHFDVQPPDPVSLWTTPPFAPEVRDGRVYARGASDMKGNLLLGIWACEAHLQDGGELPLNVKFLLEGEEEIGSPSLPAFIATHRELLKTDTVVSLDAGQAGDDQPALFVALRGLCGVQIDVRSALADAHSGLMGGLLPNAAHALVRILDSMRGPAGEILVEGFYDNVRPLTAQQRAEMAAIPDDAEAIRLAMGAKALVGERDYTPRERNWARPTLDVNGLWSGFQEDGIKTVIPSEAHAKITCRLVPDQDPERVRELLAEHVCRHAPPEVDVVVRPLPGQAKPYLLPQDHLGGAAAERVLRRIYGRSPLHLRMGASVPAVAVLREELGAYTVSFGFSQFDERMHAPDEFYRLRSLGVGARAVYELIAEMAR